MIGNDENASSITRNGTSMARRVAFWMTVFRANFSASGVTVSLVPGKAYVVNTNGSNLAESNIRASAPPGYVIEFNGIERTVYGDSTMRLRIVSKYHTFFGRAGTSSSLSTGQTHWQVALGYLAMAIRPVRSRSSM